MQQRIIFDELIRTVDGWRKEGKIDLPGTYYSSIFTIFDVTILQAFKCLPQNFQHLVDVEAASNSELRVLLGDAIKRLENRDLSWIDSPHGPTLFKALMAKNGVSNESRNVVPKKRIKRAS